MITRHRILAGVAGVLLLTGGIGAGIAATGDRDGAGWHGRFAGMGHHRSDDAGGHWHGRRGGMDRGARPVRLTDEEIDARIRERFARIDRNSDGVIDRAEVEAMMAAMPGRRAEGGPHQGGGERPMRGMQGRPDDNRDGKLTRDAFRASAEKRFADLDLDRDGKITEADLPPTLRGIGILAQGAGDAGDAAAGGRMGRGGGRGPGALVARLRAADANRDGAVTREEFLAQADKQFARRDRNSDGVVDQADRDALRKEMTDYRVLRFLHRHGAGPDGKVTREQFTQVAKERMTRMATMMGDGGMMHGGMMRGPGMMHGGMPGMMDGGMMEGHGAMRYHHGRRHGGDRDDGGWGRRGPQRDGAPEGAPQSQQPVESGPAPARP